MKKSLSIMATAAAAATMAAPGAVMANIELHAANFQQEQNHRGLKSGKSSSSSSSHDWHGPPPGWTSSSSSGKSGKGSSSKSGKGSSSHDHHHGHWAWVGGGSPHGEWGTSDDSSGKSGKSGGYDGSGKSGKGESHWHGGWGKPGWWGPGSSSSSSSKSGKGSKSKSSKGTSSSSNDWYGGWSGDWGYDYYHGHSGKSGKSGGSGSGKSGKGSHSHGHWHYVAKPWSSSSSSSGKSGKGSKGSSKSGKGSKSTSADGHWIYHSHPHSHSSSSKSTITSADEVVPPPPPDSSSPGVCAPSFYEGGLECDVDEFDYCTKVGEQAECDDGMTCYDKELCPEFSTSDPLGVCDSSGDGLDCEEVTAYCTEPGGHGECGEGRNCHDAGLCGYGDGEFDGVCGLSFHDGTHSGLDCDRVTTKCTKPGGHGECAHGSKCFDAGLCEGGKGFCSSEDGYETVDCEDTSTFCAHPGEPGQCPHGQACYDIDVCTPKLPTIEPEATSVPTYSPTAMDLMEVCFKRGEIVGCWGNDGYGDAIAVPFTYTVDTDGKTKPESVITALENAILENVVDHMLENSNEYGDFSGKISASPEDAKAADEWCGDGHAARCSVIKGEMTFYIDENAWEGDGHDSKADAVWAGDGHDLDACEASGLVKDSMEGQDYSGVDGVTRAEYRNSDLECAKIIAGASVIVGEQNESLDAGEAFALLAAAAALIALAFFIVNKKRRQPEPVEDFSLISGSLNGSFLGNGGDDPYANTIDVHKCASIFCNCNKSLSETTFLPAPKKVDMAKTMAANGISPASVNAFFPEEDEVVEEDEVDTSAGIVAGFPETNDDEEVAQLNQDNIMRMPIRSQLKEQDRPLTPVNEIAHDSEIDTEMESMADDNDDTTVPPPPPLTFHPAYRQGSGVAVMQSDDEMSI